MSFCWPMTFCSQSATCLFSPSWNIHISRNGGNRGEQAWRPLQKCGAATSWKPISRQNTHNGLAGLQDSEKNLYISAKLYTHSSVLHQNPLAQFSASLFFHKQGSLCVEWDDWSYKVKLPIGLYIIYTSTAFTASWGSASSFSSSSFSRHDHNCTPVEGFCGFLPSHNNEKKQTEIFHVFS